MTKPVFTCISDEWGTPQDFFDYWDRIFNFTLDPCGNMNRILKHDMITITKGNYICRDLITENFGYDGLTYSWLDHRVFVNPPYSQSNCKLWAKKCFDEKDNAKVIVLLIPLAKGSTGYFHKYIYPYANIMFIEKRLKFIPLEGQKEHSNPQGSMVAVFERSPKTIYPYDLHDTYR